MGQDLETKSQTIITDNDAARDHIWRLLKSGQICEVTIKSITESRTNTQNSAMHVYFSKLAKVFNDGGLDMKKVLSHNEIDIPWNANLVKECLWKRVQIALYDKKSTTKLTTKEVAKIYEVLSRHLSSKLGVYIPFPSIENNGY